MFQLGRSIREAVLDVEFPLTKWLELEEGCDPFAVYALSNFSERNIVSMTAFLRGLCSSRTLPPDISDPTLIPNPNDEPFPVSLPKAKDDFIMKLNRSTCERFRSIDKKVAKDDATEHLLDFEYRVRFPDNLGQRIYNFLVDTRFFKSILRMVGIKE